ncbi:DUF2796 domain-containing protein [Neptuniibacter sp. 1_MG-2023]|uniref:ZrgA family zinc uptake protein n=1 Tax=Neptuniibacter sp. 1_MG-2023 TaxID=3062662 RepID=UPI0026E26221|nr:DUF2796 domain-containing protein [Neptuniibacter sp. 1_MG-2023]MDO6593059.1 DUF2796 domain-containing protein [Neptuniibacter sp. 1_MG-2023]
MFQRVHYISIGSALISCMLSPIATALEAHVHGEAVLNIATDQGDVEAVLRSPMANIVGFEYEAKSAEDKATQEKALKLLQNANNILKLSASANCLTEHVEVVWGEEHGDHADHEEHEGHDDHDDHEEHADHEEHEGHDDHEEHADHEEHKGHDDHEEHADHEEHEGHDHHEEHADHEEHDHEGHADITATYHFKCSNPEALTDMTLSLFDSFKGVEKLHVNLITDKGAQQLELTPSSKGFKF